jgi:hypothetical protein
MAGIAIPPDRKMWEKKIKAGSYIFLSYIFLSDRKRRFIGHVYVRAPAAASLSYEL